MLGVNYSIQGCLISSRYKYKGISIFEVPSGDSDFKISSKNKLVAVVTRDRVADTNLKERINTRRVFICQ